MTTQYTYTSGTLQGTGNAASEEIIGIDTTIADGANVAAEIPFTIEGSSTGIPLLDPNEYMITIRERVDMSAQGPDDVIIKNAGKDIGQENYKDKSPYRPKNHPSFTVLRDLKEKQV